MIQPSFLSSCLVAALPQPQSQGSNHSRRESIFQRPHCSPSPPLHSSSTPPFTPIVHLTKPPSFASIPSSRSMAELLILWSSVNLFSLCPETSSLRALMRGVLLFHQAARSCSREVKEAERVRRRERRGFVWALVLVVVVAEVDEVLVEVRDFCCFPRQRAGRGRR
jgi:hypothetical protein